MQMSQLEHTSSALATLQPKVPEPNNKHLVCDTLVRSSSGRRRHRINLRFRSTADSANLK